MKLYIFPGSPNAKKVMIANELLGAGAELIRIDPQKREQKTPEFLAMNPNGKIPVLKLDDGSTLWESNAIINRLASMKDSELWPKSNDRYEIMKWQFWEACHWTPAIGPYISKHLFKRDEVNLEEAKENFDFYASVLNGHLESNPWLVSERMTTADISVSAILCYRKQCQYPLEPYSNILRWIEKIEALPAWQKANPTD